MMNESVHPSLCEALLRLEKMDAKRHYSFDELLQAVDDKGFGILMVVIALPSALPIPAAGYSTPFGVLIVTLGIQMLRGRHTPWLPSRAREMRLPETLFRAMLAGGTKFLRLAEHLIRPRLPWLIRPCGRRMLALLVVVMGMLMCLPIPGTNTLPAAVVFLVGVSLSEEDGLLALAATAAGVFAVAVYAAAIFFLVQFFHEYGWDAIHVFLERVKGLVKGLF